MIIGLDARPLVSPNPSGIGIYLLEILRHVEKTKGYKLILYSNETIKNPDPIISSFEQRIVNGKVGTIVICLELKKQLLKDNVDVFWGTEHMIPLFCKKIKRIVTVHDLALLINSKWGSRKNAIMQNVFCRLSCKQADHIIAISNATKNDLMSLLNINENKISVIYNGGVSQETSELSENEIVEMEHKYNVEKYKFFSYVGNIEPRKNISTIVKAYDMFCDKTKSDYKLILGGKISWRKDEIYAAIEACEHKSGIILPGYITAREKQFLMSLSTAFLFPSNYEGFGIPVIEAFSYGGIVITTDNSSLTEVGGERAFYAKNNFESLCEEMIKCSFITNSERNELMRKNKIWSKRFSWQQCSEQTFKKLITF